MAFCAGKSTVTGEFPTHRPVTRSFDIFFGLRLNEQLSKQSWGWWFETPSRSLERSLDQFNVAPVTDCLLCDKNVLEFYAKFGLCFT